MKMRSAMKLAMTLLTMGDDIEGLGDDLKEMVAAAKAEDGVADKALVLLEQLGDKEEALEAFLFTLLELADTVTDIDEVKVKEDLERNVRNSLYNVITNKNVLNLKVSLSKKAYTEMYRLLSFLRLVKSLVRRFNVVLVLTFMFVYKTF
jgi:hypothetical protein